MHLKALCAVLPSDTVAALLPSFIQVMVAKHIFQSTDFNTSLYPVRFSFGFTSLISSLSSTHRLLFALRTDVL